MASHISKVSFSFGRQLISECTHAAINVYKITTHSLYIILPVKHQSKLKNHYILVYQHTSHP